MEDPFAITPIRRKAFAYITSGTRLLLFTHPTAPDAGIQVPAGTVHPHEVPADAALREATEETGLASLRLERWIGRELFDARMFGRDELHDRWFFHISCEGAPPETWEHGERFAANGQAAPIVFRFFWANLASEVPELIAGHDRFLPELRELVLQR